jgi:hypothetical protein
MIFAFCRAAQRDMWMSMLGDGVFPLGVVAVFGLKGALVRVENSGTEVPPPRGF